LFSEQFGIPAVGIGGGFFAGILIGWALKKIIKSFAISYICKKKLWLLNSFMGGGR
jgi:uncharacterized membrane protein (Fun14 family)